MKWISPPPAFFFHWRAIERQSREKKSKREKSNYFSENFVARGNYFHVRVYFITVQRNFPSFFLLLGGDVDDGVWWWLKAKAINVCKFSSFSFKSIRLSRAHFFFTLQHFLWAFTHAKNPRVFMSSLKLFHFHVMPHKKFSNCNFELKKFCSSNHVGG